MVNRSEWAKNALQLDLQPRVSRETIEAVALGSFFRQFVAEDFASNASLAEAVEIVLGKMPPAEGVYEEFCQQERLEAIDHVVESCSRQLGNTDREELRVNVSRQLSHFLNPDVSAEIRQYATDVMSLADIVDSPVKETDDLARKLAQAVFHISAIRSSKRCEVRIQHLNQLQSAHSETELAKATKRVKSAYRIPNRRFHHPFLHQIGWTEERLENFHLGPPVHSSSQSVVPYSKDFGRRATHQKAYSGSMNIVSLLTVSIVGAAIVGGVLMSFLIADRQSAAPAFERPKAPHQVFTIVFDKDYPNKYGVEFVDVIESFDRIRELKVSPDHPGPFVHVPMSEIKRGTEDDNRD